jgi:outer membrane lipoprotein SlyB
MNKSQGVELEIRKDDGSSIMVVQKQGNSRFVAGQRVALASNGRQVTVSRVNRLFACRRRRKRR